MISIWILLILFGHASCNDDFDMKKHVDDFLSDLSSNTHNHEHHEHVHQDMKHSHGGHDHEGHVMKMWFHGGYSEVILFDFWRIESLTGLIFSCVIIFVMGAAYEGLKWFRVYLQISQSSTSMSSRPIAVTENSGCNKNLGNADVPLVISRSATPHRTSNSAFSAARIVQAALYIIQLVLAYWLMLIVMTYNSWLSIAVILGAGFGHWIFAVLKIENPQGQAVDSFATDACH